MPHFIIECSKPLVEQVSPKEILQAVHASAESSQLFAKEGVGGIKVRIKPYDEYLTVGATADFIHVFANIMDGRTTEQKSALSKMIVSKLRALFPEVAIISMNIQEFDRSTYCNRSMV